VFLPFVRKVSFNLALIEFFEDDDNQKWLARVLGSGLANGQS
jgi:hypothetical protein